MSSPCVAVQLCIRVCFRTISRKPVVGLFSYCVHASLRGCRCAFWPNFLPFSFQAFIYFNSWRIMSSVSRRYLGKRSLDCFHIAHTYPLEGVDVPFGGYDLWPNFCLRFTELFFDTKFILGWWIFNPSCTCKFHHIFIYCSFRFSLWLWQKDNSKSHAAQNKDWPSNTFSTAKKLFLAYRWLLLSRLSSM